MFDPFMAADGRDQHVKEEQMDLEELVGRNGTTDVAVIRSAPAVAPVVPVVPVATEASATEAKFRTVTPEVTHGAAASARSSGGARRQRPAFDPPRHIKEWLWLIVISSFAIVLVGSFATLAFAVVMGRAVDAASQTVLTMFTSVVGFLAGLFAPTPGQNE